MMGLLRHRVRHTTFLCFHPADQAEVQAFVEYFDHTRDVLLYHSHGTSSDPALHSSDDPAYILRRIRELYLLDASVTLVLIGQCTWASRAVDWELRASLLAPVGEPNGLLGIPLPSVGQNVTLPLRLQHNLSSGYAHLYPYTPRLGKLADYIHAAHTSRAERAERVVNPPELLAHDAPCP